jgi:hypothetical protein
MRYAHARKDEAVFPLANGIIFAVDSARLFACDMANTASVWEQIQSRAGPSLLDTGSTGEILYNCFRGLAGFPYEHSVLGAAKDLLRCRRIVFRG